MLVEDGVIKNKSHVDILELERKPVWRYSDVAAYLDISESMVRQWVMNKMIPHYKIGKSVRFDRVELKKWVDTKMVDK
jgi:excisionase family DNA binding protein